MPSPSPYSLDREPADAAAGAMASLRGARVLYDVNVIGEDGRARAHRGLHDALRAAGVQMTVRSGDRDCGLTSDVEEAFGAGEGAKPSCDLYDLHLRDAWPPRADAMLGRVNVALWLAPDAFAPSRATIAHLNDWCDLVMVATADAAARLARAGLAIPAPVLGYGVDFQAAAEIPRAGARRFLHLTSDAHDAGTVALVEAFMQGFAATDGVELVVKTVASATGGSALNASLRRDDNVADLARRAKPDAAPVILVQAPASADEMSALLRSSTALIAPAPHPEIDLILLEAMAMGVPAIAADGGDQAEFWASDAARANDFAPDPAALVAAMRATLDDPVAAKARAERGRAHLRAHCKWSDLVRRMAQALDAARRAPPRPTPATTPFGIDLVSTWAQTCGVATYAEHLFGAPALGSHLKAVFARELRGDARTPPPGTPPPAGLSRPWGYERAGADRLAAALADAEGEVCWIQHHPGLFADDDMERIVAALETSDHRLRVVTLHNVSDLVEPGRGKWLSAFDVVFVHTRRDVELLARVHGVPAVRVPHGILSPEGALAPPRAARPDVVTLGTFGFLYPHKNIPLLIEAFALARSFMPDLRLVLLTAVRDDPETLKERARVELTIEALGLGDAVEADFAFLPDDQALERLRACDFLCFPYGFSPESASGAVRMALAADRPILCSNSPVLADLSSCALIAPRCDLPHLAEALIVMASQTAVRGLRDDARRRLVVETSYPQVAKIFARRLRRHLAAARPSPLGAQNREASRV